MKAVISSLSAVAVVLGFATAAAGAEMCYGSRVEPVNTPPYYWNVAGNWLNHNNTGTILNRQPTADDDVHIWGGILAANPDDSGNPLIVSNGTVALTKAFSIGHINGSGRKILFEIQGGGVMTNHGAVVIGNDTDGNSGGLATLRAGGEWTVLNGVTVGGSKGHRNRILVEQGAAMSQTGGEFIVGNMKDFSGYVTNRGDMAVYDLFTGGLGNGTFVNEGNLSFQRKFTVGRIAGSNGTFVHMGGTITNVTKYQAFFVGHSGTGTFRVEGPLALDDDQLILGSNTGTGTLAVNSELSGLHAISVGNYDGSHGTMTVGANGSVAALPTLWIGNAAGANGTLLVSGGEVELLAKGDAGYYSLYVGKVASADGAQTGFGTIRGYGKFSRTEFDNGGKHVRMHLFGQVIADGGDLDLGAIRTVGSTAEANASGTNGWYAVNGGRLVYPRMQNFNTVNHICIGEYVFDGTPYSEATAAKDITLVNSLQLRLYDNSGAQLADNKFNFAALYAADRADIPGTVPCDAAKDEKTLGVWRLGHFSDTGDVGLAPEMPAAFGTASLRIRFDDSTVNWQKHCVVLYRWNGTNWARVGRADGSPYVATTTPQESYAGADASDNWNIGWYAVVRKKIGGMTVVVR